MFVCVGVCMFVCVCLFLCDITDMFLWVCACLSDVFLSKNNKNNGGGKFCQSCTCCIVNNCGRRCSFVFDCMKFIFKISVQF